MAPDGTPLPNIREKAQEHGFATGVVVTKEVTDATPAVFLAHNDNRGNAEAIAADYLNCGVDVLLGGGQKVFTARADGRNLAKELEAKGYRVITKESELAGIHEGKVVGLFAKQHMAKALDRQNDYLANATGKALELLSHKSGSKGFFLMVEGSQIDSWAHANDAKSLLAEMSEFDKAVGVAFDFADANPGTLVIVVADHETGGITLPSGNADFLLGDQGIEIKFSTNGHTGIMVPVYAYGAGAEHFTTIMENTDIPKKMEVLFGFGVVQKHKKKRP